MMMMKNLPLLAVSLCMYLANPARADLFAYYGFEADLTNAPSLPGPDGTDIGGAAAGIAGGIAGNAVDLETENNEHMNVQISFGALSDLGEEFTISAWYNLNDPPATNATNRYFVFEDDTNFHVSYGARDDDGGGTINDTQTFTNVADEVFTDAYTPGTWQHVAQVYTTDSGTTTITTYIDGVVSGSGVSVASANISGTGINFGAARDSQAVRGWDGLLDEIAIWDAPLSAGAIASVYNHGLGGGTIPEPTLGDADNDNDVDEFDFFLISDNLSNSVALGQMGDVDIDGQVTFNDFRIWKDNAPQAALIAAGFAVPEPATAALLGGALVFLGAATRNRIRREG